MIKNLTRCTVFDHTCDDCMLPYGHLEAEEGLMFK